MNGYITPPPGLLPPAPSVDAPRREQVPAAPAYPGFVPAPHGAPLPAQVRPAPAAPPSPSPAPADSSAPTPTAETTVVRQVEAPASVGAPVWSIELPDGASVRIERATFVGRNPTPTDAAPGGAVLPLADPAKSLSKTHAVLVPQNDYVMVTDLHSTNGTAVISPDGAVTVLEPGRTSPIAAGSRLQLGSFVVTVGRTQ